MLFATARQGFADAELGIELIQQIFDMCPMFKVTGINNGKDSLLPIVVRHTVRL